MKYKQSVSEFKSWLSKQGSVKHLPLVKSSSSADLPKSIFTSFFVESRLGEERLKQQIKKFNESIDDSKLNSVVKTFKQNGAIVLDDSGMNYILEVEEQKFELPKTYVKLAATN